MKPIYETILTNQNIVNKWYHLSTVFLNSFLDQFLLINKKAGRLRVKPALKLEVRIGIKI